MNPAIMVAIMAATQQQEQEDKAEARLREAKGVVVRTASGRVYLSERRLADRREGTGFTVLLVMLVVMSLIASGIALVVTVAD